MLTEVVRMKEQHHGGVCLGFGQPSTAWTIIKDSHIKS